MPSTSSLARRCARPCRAAAPAQRAATSLPRRRLSPRIFVVRCGLPCDPPVGGHSCNGGMTARSVTKKSDQNVCVCFGGSMCIRAAGQAHREDRALARQYGRYGYRKIAELLRRAGWTINDMRVERIWQREGRKVPHQQPKRGRIWLTNGSCIRPRPEQRNHVWSYDFVEDRTHDGRKYRMLNVLDEFTHECLAIRVARKLKAIDVIDVLSDLFILRGIPAHIRSDNGPEFVAKAVQDWIAAVGAKTASIERGSPWENGYIESFNARLRDELLNGEIFYTLRKAQIVIESWRRHYNTIRPHASIGYKPPAPEVFVPAFAAWPAALRRPAPPATLAQRPTLN